MKFYDQAVNFCRIGCQRFQASKFRSFYIELNKTDRFVYYMTDVTNFDRNHFTNLPRVV